MPTATFILSTGRCGTQWLAENLNQVYGDLITVEHEPLDNDYQPRRMLGAKSPTEVGEPWSTAILNHVDMIERQLERKSYIECGHPCWSTLPYLAARLRGRIRIIHLTRHPIPTALSWLSQFAYEPPLLPQLPEKVLLSPEDVGVAFPEYRHGWASMGSFEKCLYYWAEVNAFGLRLESQEPSPWLRLRFEGLFEAGTLTGLLNFLEVPTRSGLLNHRGDRVDKHHFKAPSAFPDLAIVSRHPRVVEVADALGYAPSCEDVRALRERYSSPGMGD